MTFCNKIQYFMASVILILPRLIIANAMILVSLSRYSVKLNDLDRLWFHRAGNEVWGGFIYYLVFTE